MTNYEREKGVEKYFVERCKQAGFWPMKFVSPNLRGVPDRIVILPNGLTAYVELKRQGGVISPLQRAVMRKLNEYKAPVYVVFSKKEADDVIDKLQRQAEKEV